MFGNRLKQRRTKLGHTQESVAEMLGTDARRIWAYESGKTKPNGEVIAELARYLDTSTDYLLGLTDDPTPHDDLNHLSDDEKALLAAIRRGDSLTAIRLIVTPSKSA